MGILLAIWKGSKEITLSSHSNLSKPGGTVRSLSKIREWVTDEVIAEAMGLDMEGINFYWELMNLWIQHKSEIDW